MLNMIRKIWTPSSARRRSQTLDDFRRQIAAIGYALDDLTDAQLEAKITRGKTSIEKLPPLTGKALYWALRQISPDDGQLRMRKLKQA